MTSGLVFSSKPRAQPGCNGSSSMNIVAHEDDDILFLSPDLLHDIQNGRCVRTVFVTAGDANLGLAYAKDRAIGARAAYAQMANLPSAWTISDATVSGHPIPVYTLRGNAKISLVFLKLPDGNFDGSGFSNNNYQSLQKLLTGVIPDIKAIDGSNVFTEASLRRTILQLIRDFRPNELRTQDTGFSIWDHSDHRAVASLVKSAHVQYVVTHSFFSYIDYMSLFYLPNIFGSDFLAKENAFSAYTAYDSEIGCYSCFYNPYFYWLKRQYISNSSVR
jgi:LmbE family N-acetylglucosaminyl deacetylase